MSGKTWRVSNIVKWVGDDEKLVPIFFEHGEYFIEVFELQGVVATFLSGCFVCTFGLRIAVCDVLNGRSVVLHPASNHQTHSTKV
eukprot:286059-Amorphochlora_amoeboformis.AAC.3